MEIPILDLVLTQDNDKTALRRHKAHMHRAVAFMSLENAVCVVAKLTRSLGAGASLVSPTVFKIWLMVSNSFIVKMQDLGRRRQLLFLHNLLAVYLHLILLTVPLLPLQI